MFRNCLIVEHYYKLLFYVGEKKHSIFEQNSSSEQNSSLLETTIHLNKYINK
jgi:hypothetical protein